MRRKPWDMNTGRFGTFLFLMLTWSLMVFPFVDANAGAFSPTGSLSNPRSRHTSTLLPNGKVLIVGGFGINTPSYSSVELYDTSSETFTATGSMGVSRNGCTATLLLNGKVLIAGGANSTTGGVSSAELYDPSTGTFTFTGPMLTGRYDHTATLLSDGKVLVAGGYNHVIQGGIDLAEIYDPSTGVFTPTGSMTRSRYRHTATLLPNGKVLIAGGGAGTGYPQELYNPSTKVFSSTGTMHVDRFWHTATLLGNGKALIVGGIELAGSNAILNGSELYDPSTGIFTFAANMSIGRTNHTATLLSDGKVLVAGGGAPVPFGTQSSAEVYDPANGFSVTGPMKTRRQSQTSTLLANGKVIVAGGETPIGTTPPGPTLTPVSSAELYDPSAIPDTTGPTVISAIPVNGATGVSISTAITIIFSEAQDGFSIIAPSAFILSGGGVNVTCDVNWNNDRTIFTPRSPLAYNTTYTATITTSVKDALGNPMDSDYTWSFTTEQASSGGGGGGGGGCSVSPTEKQDAQSSVGIMFALLSPIFVLAIRRTLRRI
jgi:hypothetical protein